MPRALCLIAAIALTVFACDSADPASPGASSTSGTSGTATSTPPAATDGFETQALTIVKADAARVGLTAELAVTGEQRAQGLMGRDALAPDSGMLFAIQPPGRGFWMRGTTIPLTVAFIGECGEIVDFADLEPLSEEIKNTDQPYAFALEMERGWFAAHGVETGDVVELPERFRQDGC
jgi:uncharacterized membrane protein (UPF0127 family)